MSGIRLTRRLAEETQLLAEEKWITEALNKIKKQRNCLQIERLHLEGMKAQVKIDLDKKGRENKPESSGPDISLANLQKPSNEFLVRLDEESCNKEKLNLAVNDNLFGNTLDLPSFNMEEEEEDDDLSEDVFIDMNMLMNGEQISKKWK